MPTILIIDDNELQLTLLSAMFINTNYRVICLNSTSNLLSITKAIKPDVILLDLIMPEKNGDIVYKELRKSDETKGIPVIFVSSADICDFDFSDVDGSLDINSFVKKPIIRDDLHEVIKKRLANDEIKKALDRALETCNLLKDV